jgi:hypothetical protein
MILKEKTLLIIFVEEKRKESGRALHEKSFATRKESASSEVHVHSCCCVGIRHNTQHSGRENERWGGMLEKPEGGFWTNDKK